MGWAWLHHWDQDTNRDGFEYPQHKFCLRNKKIIFHSRSLILRLPQYKIKTKYMITCAIESFICLQMVLLQQQIKRMTPSNMGTRTAIVITNIGDKDCLLDMVPCSSHWSEISPHECPCGQFWDFLIHVPLEHITSSEEHWPVKNRNRTEQERILTMQFRVKMSQYMSSWYISRMRATMTQASLNKRSVSSEHHILQRKLTAHASF